MEQDLPDLSDDPRTSGGQPYRCEPDQRPAYRVQGSRREPDRQWRGVRRVSLGHTVHHTREADQPDRHGRERDSQFKRTAGDNGGSAITGWKYQHPEGNNDWGGWTAVPNSGASTTSYTVTGLTNGATYKFKVRAVNAGDGTPSDESASVSPEVGLVTLTASEITRTSATLTLANHTGGWSYKSTAAHSPCNAVAAGTTEVSLTDLTAGTIYNYVAFSSSTCGPTSAEIARETFTTLAAANLTASAVGATTATLTIGNHPAAWWYKRTAPTGDNTCHSVPANDDDDDLSNLASGTSHTYKAYSDSSCSVELASETFLTKPGQTTGVSLDPGSTEIGVSWTEVTGAASYKVQWKLSSDDDYNTGNRQKEVTPGTSTSTSITGLTNATEYTVRVAAVNRTGDGEWSDEASATPKAITLTATNVAQTTATLKIAGYTKAWAFSRTDNPDLHHRCRQHPDKERLRPDRKHQIHLPRVQRDGVRHLPEDRRAHLHDAEFGDADGERRGGDHGHVDHRQPPRRVVVQAHRADRRQHLPQRPGQRR